MKTSQKRVESELSTELYERAAEIVVNVLFGSPHRNCEGTGICKVVAPVAHKIDRIDRRNCKKAVAVVRKKEKGILEFRFVKKSMCKKQIARYFSDDLFVIESPFDFRWNFWSREYYSILPGIYPAEHCEAFITVRFDSERKSRD